MALTPAVTAAVEWLLRARDDAAGWRDFDIAGESTSWVSAYVGAALATVPDPRARAAAERAWALVRRERWWAGGWGYGPWVPADGDSTTWALRLAEAVSPTPSLRVRRGHAFLARHLRPGGGLATYAGGWAIGRFTGLRTRFDGWCGAHDCVTAAAAALRRFPARPRLLERLRARERADGSWGGYWWCDPEYTTALAAEALAAEALAAGDRADDRERVRAAVRWAARRIGDDGAVTSALEPGGSPFATAAALRVLDAGLDDDGAHDDGAHDDGAHDAGERAAAWLVGAQRADGSWVRSARLRVPPPDVADPDSIATWGRDGRGPGSIGTVVVDRRGVFTTASVVRALHRLRRREDADARGRGAGVR